MNSDITYSEFKKNEDFYGVCLGRPDFGYANSWNDSMEQCKNSQPPYYLLGDVRLNNPDHACISLNYQFPLVWIGVVRQVYTSIDKGMYLISLSTQL